MNRKTFKRSVIAASLVAVTAGGFAGFGNPVMAAVEAVRSSVDTPVTAAASAAAASVPGLATATDFSGIVKQYGPAVVHISVLGKAEATPARGQPFGPGHPFSELFPFGPFGGGPDGGRGGIPDVPGPQTGGLGSGFIVSPDGLIMTNAHVVDGAEEVTVRMTDRREYKAKVLGADKQTDVAVLKIEARDLPYVRIGDPNASTVGEPVLAIGSPYGLQNTATAGIISAKSRALPDDTYVPFIQTDVAVNPGNSGGPLFNLKGEVIGINSQIYSRTGGYQGLSFAIPMDVALHVKDQLVEHGKVTRGRLGVSVQSVTQGLAESLGLKSLDGALVAGVENGGPAAKGGLEPGDVIVRFGDQPIRESTDLPASVARTRPGSKVEVEVVRNGKPHTVNVIVGDMQGTTVAGNGAEAQQQGRLGLAVRPLAPQEQRSAGVDGGVLIEHASGPAARAGLEAGDILLAFNGKPVKSVEQLRELVGKSGRTAAVLIQRDDTRLFVPVQLG